MTTSPVMTENSQCYPTVSTSSLSFSTHQYFDKSTTQELQPIHGSASQTSQSNEPLQSCSQLSNFSRSKCTPENNPKNDNTGLKDKIERFMDAFEALDPEGKLFIFS